jgi:hypothetical protein
MLPCESAAMAFMDGGGSWPVVFKLATEIDGVVATIELTLI